MLNRTDLTYSYDGSFDGLMCCVFESYARKEIPFDIHSVNGDQGWLFESRWIETDPVKAERVFQSIPKRISREAQELVQLGYYTCSPRKEMLVLEFLRLGFDHGGRVMDMLADDTVHALNKAVHQLKREAHRFKGFVRFSVYGEVMAAVIEPENQVLPLLMDHFCDRFGREAFMIYDQTHGMALVHQPGEAKIIPVDELTLPETDAEEEGYRRMWRRFYETAAVEGRINLRLRMAHMPKKYWGRITEMAGDKERNWAALKEQAGTKSAGLLPRSIKE